MSNTSSSYGSSRGIDYRPSTPDRTRPTLSRSNSLAPKSEYLRHALQARRAQGTPTPSPQDIKVPPPPAQKVPEICTPKTSPDIFDQFALTEEQTTPVSPIRRRRPSNAGPPQSRTSRELTDEIDKLKQTLMTANMRVELLHKDNRVLQQNLTAAKEQVERLEPLEDQNYELNAENRQLRLKMEKMDEEISKLREINEEHRKTNIELTTIASESAAHWTDHELAIEEAAEHIIKMEEEKELLSEELKQIKQRVMAIESHSPASTLVNSPGKFPLRVFSVDESRPSTSHFDSDYYSQPESPQAKHSSASIMSFTPSERSKKFLDLKEERRRSARDLSERMSAVSLKALRDASLSPTPEEVPAVPTTHQQQVPSIVADDSEVDPRKAKDQWWRSLDRLTHSQVMAQEIQAQGIQTSQRFDAGSNPPAVAPPNSALAPKRTRSSSTTGQHRSRRPTPTPSSALNSHPVSAEKDFLFNAKESTEDFMSKMRGGKGSRDSVFSLR
ncbi:hypothetical protein J4E93_005495 [Alternaria ventricosa]|uniref:uncharacterized protein n=1 Tax=Alternaria ventricosa TaxID=1187951 RepID=UPI0020C3348E|nr:uncharacterized protein J4E93_005495 [Alternaria ventricosa]KAI4645916.1 hypothetical protein J4E93_005495 [Alternaria ventricosa]